MKVLQILPAWMFGIGDIGPTASGQLVMDFMNGKFPGLFEGGSSIVDARDVAQAMIDSVEKGENGEKYIVGGNFHTIEDLANALSKATGKPAPKFKIPSPFLIAFATGAELFTKLTGVATTVSKNGIKTLQAKLEVDSSKAVNAFGTKFTPFEETIRNEVEWYKANGYAG